MAKLDHIMYAVSELQDGIDEILNLTGVTAEFGGTHPGNGTCNALLSFDNSQYLEIIAPDANQDLAGTLGEELKVHDFSGIRTWAVAVDDFAVITPVLDEFGFEHSIVPMNRTRPDGVRLDWQIMFVHRHPYGNFMPFFLNWLDSPHPANDTPGGCTLDTFAVEMLENSDSYKELMRALEIEVEVLEGPDGMRAVIDSPNGRVLLH
ncbi:MAG: VOC family protein [Gammaproteobacteria bacterium]|nr:VOC family protein [Gammaproteobacteria bacterium]